MFFFPFPVTLSGAATAPLLGSCLFFYLFHLQSTVLENATEPPRSNTQHSEDAPWQCVCVLISLLAMDFWIRERARNEQKKRWGEKNNTRHNIKVEEMKREK